MCPFCPEWAPSLARCNALSIRDAQSIILSLLCKFPFLSTVIYGRIYLKGCNSERFFGTYVLFHIAVVIFCNFLYSHYIYNWCYMRGIQKFTKSFD